MLLRKRRQVDSSKLNSIEEKSFVSINCSICWIGTTCSIFYADFWSRLQQKANNATIGELLDQHGGLKNLKLLCKLSLYDNVNDDLHQMVSVVIFCDAGRHHASAKIADFAGVIVDETKKSALFHLFSRSSHKANRPVHLTKASKTLAAGEAIDERKMLCLVLSSIYNVQISLRVMVDSKDLFFALNKQRE